MFLLLQYAGEAETPPLQQCMMSGGSLLPWGFIPVLGHVVSDLIKMFLWETPAGPSSLLVIKSVGQGSACGKCDFFPF